MPPQAFATITHQAAAMVSRRTSLLTLAGAALAAVTGNPSGSAAKKRKAGNTCKKKEQQRCRADAAACRATLLDYCPDDPSPVSCLAATSCCDTCSANGFLTCLAALAA